MTLKKEKMPISVVARTILFACVLLFIISLAIVVVFVYRDNRSVLIQSTNNSLVSSSNTQPEGVIDIYRNDTSKSGHVTECSYDLRDPFPARRVDVSMHGYRTIRVDNGYQSYSFEIPNEWLAETRHARDRELTICEKREFLSTSFLDDPEGDVYSSFYIDVPQESILSVADRIIEQWYDEELYPEASVGEEYILYGDISWWQIDFRYFENFFENEGEEAAWELRTYASRKCGTDEENKVAMDRGGEGWYAGEIGGRPSCSVSFGLDVDESGNSEVTKGGTGGKKHYIPMNGGKDMFVIWQQASPDELFQIKANGLLDSFRFD